MTKNIFQKSLNKPMLILLPVIMIFAIIACSLFVNFKASADNNDEYVKHIYFKINTGETFSYSDKLTGESGTSDFLDLGFVDPNVDFGYALDSENNTFTLKGHDSTSTSTEAKEHDCTIKLTVAGHKVLDYNESFDGLNATVTLYVQGSPVDVVYDGNGGNWRGETSLTIPNLSGSGFIFPESVPAYEGHEFLGYYTEQEGGKLITFSSPTIDPVPEGGTTLWAHWKDVSAPTSLTINSTNGNNFKFIATETPDGGDPISKDGETNKFVWDYASEITSDAVLFYKAEFTNNDELLPDEVKSSPYALVLSTYDATKKTKYDFYFFTDGNAGSYITKATYLNSTVDEMNKSIIFKGENTFDLDVETKDNMEFTINTEQNLVVNCEWTKYETSETRTMNISSLHIDLDKSAILYFTYNNSFMANDASYDLPVNIYCLSMDENDKYVLDWKFAMKGLVTDEVSNASAVTVDGFQYGDEVVTTPSLEKVLINSEDTTLTVLTSGGGKSVNSTFNANGGKFADDSEVLNVDQTTGVNIVLPEENPSLEGMAFDGWYTAAEGGELVTTDMYPWDPDDESKPWDPEGEGIEANTFYAHWTDAPGPEPEPEPTPDPTPGTEINAQTGDSSMGYIAVLSVLLITAGCAYALNRRTNKKH